MSNLATIEQSQAVAITPTQMLQIAVEQNADIDKLSKLMDLQERWQANEAKKAFTQAMANFRRDCPPIEKTRSGHNIKYAGLAETLGQINALMADNGLSHDWETGHGEGGYITVKCTVTHQEGHSKSTALAAAPDTSGSKNAIQSIGSAVTYLERYTLFAILGLASQDEDTDGRTNGRVITEGQAASVKARLESTKSDVKRFLKALGIPSVDAMPAAKYAQADNMLTQKEAATTEGSANADS